MSPGAGRLVGKTDFCVGFSVHSAFPMSFVRSVSWSPSLGIRGPNLMILRSLDPLPTVFCVKAQRELREK